MAICTLRVIPVCGQYGMKIILRVMRCLMCYGDVHIGEVEGGEGKAGSFPTTYMCLR